MLSDCIPFVFGLYKCRTLVFSDGRFDPNLDSLERARKANPIGTQNVAKVHWRLYQCYKIAYLSFSASISVEPWFLAMVALTLIWTARKGPGKQIQLAPRTLPKCIGDYINAVRLHTFRFRLL